MKIEAHMQHLAPPVEHVSPYQLLREQQRLIGEYLHILEVRAVIEGINL